MSRTKHPRFTYGLDTEGCDSIWIISDNAAGADLAGVRFWDSAQETESEVKAIVSWLNRHAESWMAPARTRKRNDLNAYTPVAA